LRRFITGSLMIPVLFFIIGGIAFSEQTVNFKNSPSEIKLLNQDRMGLTLAVEIGSLHIIPVTTREGAFLLLTVDGFSRSHQIGEPNVPMINRLLSIPFGCELQAEVIESEYEIISLAELGFTEPVMPTQPSLSKSEDPEDVPFEYSRDLYQKAGYYSLPLTKTSITGIMRSQRLGMVSIAPVEYNPLENKLKVYTHLKIKVDYLNPDWLTTQAMQRNYYSPVFEPVYGQLFNYERMDPVILDDLVKYPIKYLIIADTMFAAQLQPFIEWKTKKGFKVEIAYTSVIGNTTTQIKNHIHSVYSDTLPPNGPAPSFVLFVGDTPQIPTYDGSAGSHVTDLRYCEFTGDNLPEIYYGRWSAQEPDDLQPQIDKTLEYELLNIPDTSYLGEVTMISGVDASHAPTYGNGQINYGTNLYFNAAHGILSHTWLYPASNDPSAAAAIRQTVNEGIGYINYTAHCSHSGFGNPSFTVDDIDNLTNIHKYLLAVGNCCESNTFDETTPCFGEAWLQAENKGGVGYIGASNSTYWDEDYYWGVGAGPIIGSGPSYEQTGLGAYDGVFHDHGEPVTQHYITNDAIIYRGNLGVTEDDGPRVAYYWETYHLMGDPSIMNYMGVPSPNNIIHDPAVLLTATSFTVQADPGSYVGISIDGVLHGAAYIGQTGTVDVPLEPFASPGSADIVITAQNRLPYVSTIQIIPPQGPYVIYDSYSINDLAGNNNGMVDAGESIVLGVQVKNVGLDNANNVGATLSTSDPDVTITDANETYGTVPGNDGIVNRPSAFSFNVQPGVFDGHNIPFQLTVTGTALDEWISNFSIPVHAPAFQILSLDINDASGNNNGILDPGETAQIVVTLENYGSGEAGSIVGVLSESDAFVTIDDANGTFGDIAPSGGTADNSGDVFVASASAACPTGHQVILQLTLSGALGYGINLYRDIIVGDKVTIFFDDFSSGEGGWTGLGGTAEWQIGPATGGPGTDTYGGPDPSLDNTPPPSDDNYVMGNDLSPSDGDYAQSMTQTYWVTSRDIDCTDYTSVIMTYYHWLGIERNNYDHAYLQVYNGTSWITLFENGSETIDETSWNMETYDLTDIADENANFKIRFGIGTTDGSWQYCGWNIDDIKLKGFYIGSAEPPDMSYSPTSLADSLIEGQTATHYINIHNTGLGTLRVRFTLSAAWLEFDTEQQYIPPEDSLAFPVTMNAAGLDPGMSNGTLNFTSNDDDLSSGSIPVSLYIYAPDMHVNPSSIVGNVEVGGQSSVPMVMSNTGAGRLYYEIYCEDSEDVLLISSRKHDADLVKEQQAIKQKPIGYHPVELSKSSEPEPIYPPVILDQGGPDAFGYTWIDSDEPNGPTYTWVNITSIGTPITGISDDTNVGPFPIGFNFEFYGNTFNTFRFCTNGFISFTSTDNEYSNTALPNNGSPLNMIAAFWDDLTFYSSGNAYYYTNNVDSLVVSWVNVPRISNGGPYTFQIILLRSGKIIYQYQNMNSPTNSATVGIQNNNGTIGLQMAYNAEYARSNLAVLIKAGPDWLATDPELGMIEPETLDTIDVLFDATDLDEGTYNGQLAISCNDPATPSMSVPVTLLVGPQEVAVIELNITSIADTLYIDEMWATELIIKNIGTGDLDFTVSDNRTWILEDVTGGSVVPADSEIVTITLSALGMPEGTYVGTITVNSNDPVNGTILIPATMVVEAMPGCEYVPGDINGNGDVIGSDITYGVNFFKGIGDVPPDSCWDDSLDSWLYVAGDVNGNCEFLGSDITYMISYFRGHNPELHYCPRIPPLPPPVMVSPDNKLPTDIIGNQGIEVPALENKKKEQIRLQGERE
jgi:hypothetical protein